MIDFDATLQRRLARLDAAIPEMAASHVERVARRRDRRRQIVLLLAATVALLGITAIGTMATPPPPDPAVVAKHEADEERVRADLGPLVSAACLSPDQAVALVRERLDALGLSDWTVRNDGRAAAAPCAGAAPAGDIQEVLIMPNMGLPVSMALAAMRAGFLSTCLDRYDAVEQLRSTLKGLGIVDPKIEVTAIRSVPIDHADAYVQHVKDGCYGYGDAQFDQTGRYTWSIYGP